MPDEEAQDLRSILSQVVTDAETAAAETPAPRPAREERQSEASLATTEPPEEGDDAASQPAERPRGPDGKFLPKEAVADENSPETSETPAEKPSSESPLAVDVPAHWSQADKDLVAGLPKEHQAKVVERYKAIEAGFTPKLQRAAEIERQYQGAMQLFEPHLEGLRQRGQTPSDVIRAWASIEQDMMQGRDATTRGMANVKGAEHVARMIRAYNIDPGHVAALLQGQPIQNAGGNGAGQAQPQTYVPPELIQEITSVKQQVQGIIDGGNRAREAQTQAQIDAFANEKDASGALKHPYFSELERDMMAIAQIEISQGKVPTIADLYDRAVYANRETRSKVLAAEQAEASRKAAAERKAKAEAAAKASSSITGSPGAGGSPAERSRARTLREEIMAAASEVDVG